MRASLEQHWREVVTRVLVLLSFAITAMVLSAGWWLLAVGQWLARPAEVAPVDAIVVLGGGYPYRDQHGIDLYRQGVARELWRTGTRSLAGDSVTHTVLQLAQDRGVPQQSLFLLETDSTWTDGQQIASLAQERGTQRILVVTDWSHSRRALCVISQHLQGRGITILYDPPQDFPFQIDNWWRHPLGRQLVVGELIKIGYYWLRYGTPPFGC